MWIGPIPFELEILTFSEQMLVALAYPRCFVFKLYPRDGRISDPDSLQWGIRGNVTSYELNNEDIFKMVEGKLLPRPLAMLPSVIAVTFVGVGKLPKAWLRRLFRVRRQVVFDALRWMKANNYMYGDMRVDIDRFREYPLDDVPLEVSASVGQLSSDTIAEEERAGYVEEDPIVGDAPAGKWLSLFAQHNSE